MRPALSVLLIGCSLALAPAPARAASIQRFALVVGANNGGSGRPPLRYAVSDAERFARVLVDLGGVGSGNVVLLRQPGAGELDRSLSQLRTRVDQARAAAGPEGGRTEVLVYFSGHADEKGAPLPFPWVERTYGGGMS